MIRQLHRRDHRADLRELITFRQAQEELIKRDLKSRYKRSSLGLVWTLLNPLLMMLVTSVIFSSFFDFAIRNFSTYMLSAYILWMFFSQATLQASTSLRQSAGLARRVYLPPAVFPLAAVNGAAVNLLFSIAPLFVIVLVTGGELSLALLFLPVAIALTVLFTYGVALILAAASVFFHDLVLLYQVVVMAWMYLTPIFYPIDIVPEDRHVVFYLNPMFHFTQIFRDPIYAGAWPDPFNVAAATGFAFVTVAVGWWYFERSRDTFAAYL
jgi:ABC-type polysaccharide/polyol phosphate export permease